MAKMQKHKIIDNRGSSFVEIIVSVLVVGIIFVPLLLGMNTAIIINRMSQNEQYADAVAQNCIESVKAIGKKSIDAKFATPAPAGPSAEGEGESGAADTVTTQFDVCYPGATISKTGTSKYTVSGIKQGTKSFTADLEFVDEYSGAGKQNDSLTSLGISPKSTTSVNFVGQNQSVLHDVFNNDLAVTSVGGQELTPTYLIGILKEKKNIVNIDKDATTNKYVISASIQYVFYNHENVSSTDEIFKDPTGTLGDEFVKEVVLITSQEYDTLPEVLEIYIDSIAKIDDTTGINQAATSVVLNPSIGEGSINSLAGSRPIGKETVVINKNINNALEVQTNISGVNGPSVTGAKLYYDISNSSTDANNLTIYNPLGDISSTATVLTGDSTTVADAPSKFAGHESSMMYKLVVTVKDVDSDYSLTRESTLIG